VLSIGFTDHISGHESCLSGLLADEAHVHACELAGIGCWIKNIFQSECLGGYLFGCSGVCRLWNHEPLQRILKLYD